MVIREEQDKHSMSVCEISIGRERQQQEKKLRNWTMLVVTDDRSAPLETPGNWFRDNV